MNIDQASSQSGMGNSSCKETASAIRLVIAGGGTGGHVFPGLAVYDGLREMRPVEAMWIGTGRAVESRALETTTVDYRILKVHPLKGTGMGSMIKAMCHLPVSVLRTISMLRSFKPDVVLGVGGYVSGPVIFAAKILGIPSAIHEQNLLPGLANRMAARFASRIFLSFKDSVRYFPAERCLLTGNPVRKEILLAAEESRVAGSGRDFHLLIIGGSQGASSLNRLACSAIKALKDSGFSLTFLHQTGEKDLAQVQKFYAKHGIAGDVRPFISEMGRAYRAADLVVCRAGATTIAELTVVGRPSILIPYPFAAEGHQDLNARFMERMGAGIFLKEADTGAVKLSSNIETFMEDREKLAKMAQSAKKLGMPNAYRKIAENLVEIAGFSSGRS